MARKKTIKSDLIVNDERVKAAVAACSGKDKIFLQTIERYEYLNRLRVELEKAIEETGPYIKHPLADGRYQTKANPIVSDLAKINSQLIGTAKELRDMVDKILENESDNEEL